MVAEESDNIANTRQIALVACRRIAVSLVFDALMPTT